MRLYSKATSERATKGQGGQNFIHNIITADDELVVDVMVDSYNDDEWRVRVDLMGEIYFRTSPKEKRSDAEILNDETMKELTGETDKEYNERLSKQVKGKKQKGENMTCNYCAGLSKKDKKADNHKCYQ